MTPPRPLPARLLSLLTLVAHTVPALPAALATRVRRHPRDAGMSTAEYAVGTVAAVAFAAVLYQVVRSGAVRAALSSILTGALNVSL